MREIREKKDEECPVSAFVAGFAGNPLRGIGVRCDGFIWLQPGLRDRKVARESSQINAKHLNGF
ncbi:MAG: hypothetical protein IPN69_17985 [Acidobacteria bacterium]|nr:hypothetical protein [Acidobacteriota bacterium]MBK8151530.1 hypothetical protein [Acidobacteriota bacterium]MBK8812602.1 hypothetical protein [Acidobacteriota bacterium]